MIATEDRTGTQATSPQSLRHKDSCLASPVPDGSHGGTMKCDRHRMPSGHPGDIPTITGTQIHVWQAPCSGRPRARTVRMEAL